ncbi:MAG: ankyrin repeat domain-containing protein [Deltaproteobacteria bacterium]|jgi:TPR repeat protein|nr:ankyrin repeat domain-containing protein [Deltaproteobacteria bacterium]
MALDSNNNNYRQTLFSAITFFILTFLICPVAFGVMPPEYYKKAIRSSKIKAIAVVKKVKIISETNSSTFKKVLFKLEKSFPGKTFHKEVPQEFSGLCYSVDHKWQDPGMGGTIHYYPIKGKKVLVTVSSDGGSITSYTTLSPAFEEELNQNGLKNIEFGMGSASIKESAMSPASKREQRVEACASLGRWYYYTAKNYQKAFHKFKEAARFGHAYSQNHLGDMYFNGLGVEQNFQKALEWHEKSAEQNNFSSMYSLGVMYANGKGVKQSYKKAFALFLKSAELGYSRAQFNLGTMYYNGFGVDKDESIALKWFQKAADNNIPKAVYEVGRAYESGNGLSKNINKAKEYYKKAAGLGYLDAGRKLRDLDQNEIDMNMEKSTTSPETKKLFNALYENNMPMVKKLLDLQVDANSRNEIGQTPLHIALNEKIIKLLISKGADVNARDDQGMTPIFNKAINQIILLVKAGADINLQSREGNTAVMWFAYSGYLDGIRYLVSQGADIKVKNKYNQTASDIAEKFGHLKVVEYLESARFEIWLKSGKKNEWP